MCYDLIMIEKLNMDKKSISIVNGFDNGDARQYWHTASPSKRMQFIEIMRQINYGYNPVTDRLQRILTVVEKT